LWFFTEMRTFPNISKTTLAAILVKEKSTEKERGLARISAIEHEWAEDWFTCLGTLQAVHGRLTSGIHACENPSQANQSSTHSSSAFLLAHIVQKQNQKIRKSNSNSSELCSECLAFAYTLDFSHLSADLLHSFRTAALVVNQTKVRKNLKNLICL